MSMYKLLKNKKGIMKIETLVIFISMILVAAVSAVLLMAKNGIFTN